MKREWGYYSSSSSAGSLALDDDNTTTMKEGGSQIQTPKSPGAKDILVKDEDEMQIPVFLLRTQSKVREGPSKHPSDLSLRKKKTNVEYRIKKLSKSPQKYEKEFI